MNIFKVYAVVGTTRNESWENQRAAFRRRAKELHPDKGGEGPAFSELTAAWNRISNPTSRAKLDMEYRMMGHKCAECSGDGVKRRMLSFTRSEETPCPVCEGCGFVPSGRAS